MVLSYIYYLMGYEDEIEADERQIHLRHQLHKQIVNTDMTKFLYKTKLKKTGYKKKAKMVKRTNIYDQLS